jgi:hypothetical protein
VSPAPDVNARTAARRPSPQWWSQLPFSNFLRFWDYRPRTDWLDHFITINWNANDGEVEQHVLGEVGSYGYQLSRILEAVDLLVGRLSLTSLDPDQQKVVVRLQDLAAQARHAVEDYRSSPTPDAR